MTNELGRGPDTAMGGSSRFHPSPENTDRYRITQMSFVELVDPATAESPTKATFTV